MRTRRQQNNNHNNNNNNNIDTNNRQNRNQNENHNHNINNSNNNNSFKPSTPPPQNRPDSIIDDGMGILSSPEPSQGNNDKPIVIQNTNNRQNNNTDNKKKAKTKTKAKAKNKKAPTKKRKKKKKYGANLGDEDEWSDSSGGSIGSLKDFVMDDIADSDEEYDVMQDINAIKRGRKRYRRFGSNGDDDMIGSDEDEDDDLDESFSSLMNLNGNLNSFNSMIITSPPKKKRKGIRTVCNILPLCQWGEKCFRKNESHFKQYYHPWKNLKK